MKGGMVSVGILATLPNIIVKTIVFNKGCKMYHIGPSIVCL